MPGPARSRQASGPRPAGPSLGLAVLLCLAFVLTCPDTISGADCTGRLVSAVQDAVAQPPSALSLPIPQTRHCSCLPACLPATALRFLGQRPSELAGMASQQGSPPPGGKPASPPSPPPPQAKGAPSSPPSPGASPPSPAPTASPAPGEPEHGLHATRSIELLQLCLAACVRCPFCCSASSACLLACALRRSLPIPAFYR